MGYQVYRVGRRWGGYGIPAICEYPSCKKEIDRGISFACGGEPFSELGCDRYFCSKHRKYTCFNSDGEPDENEEENCIEVCAQCAENKEPFDYKPEHKKWVEHLLTDESWEQWRKENPDEVKELSSPTINS